MASIMNVGTQHAFRVRLPAKPESSTVIGEESSPGPIHTRRAHTKSRKGCECCKQRRKKCDERKPSCSLCMKKNMRCSYAEASHAQQRKPLACKVNMSRLPHSLWPGPRSPTVLTAHSNGTHTKYDLFLIDYWVKYSAKYFEGPEVSGVFSTKAFDLAKEYPYIMHAMIALAACHLQYVGIDARCYRMPEAFHIQMASRGLRDAVVSINGAKEADAVLTTSMLLNSLAFCTKDYCDVEERESYGELRWDWLKISIGITDLLIRTRPFHPESIWLPMFVATQACRVTESPVNDLDEQLATICGIDADSNEENNIYFDFWKQLAPVITRPPNLKHMRLYINAIGGITYQFIELLEKKDVPALLLFAHWAALMSSVQSWWPENRTVKICWTTCHLLQRKLNGNQLKLLEFPAEVCGFSLGSNGPICPVKKLSWDGLHS